MNSPTDSIRRCRAVIRRSGAESGQAAGIESIPFGILVFVGGVLLVINLWSVVDTRASLDSAARDYLRAYTAAPDRATARIVGRAAARASLSSRSGRPSAVRIGAPTERFGPCRPATVRLELTIDAIHAPFIGTLGTAIVSTTQTELVEPYGVALDEPGPTRATVCDG